MFYMNLWMSALPAHVLLIEYSTFTVIG